jgi:hypothetical protein
LRSLRSPSLALLKASIFVQGPPLQLDISLDPPPISIRILLVAAMTGRLPKRRRSRPRPGAPTSLIIPVQPFILLGELIECHHAGGISHRCHLFVTLRLVPVQKALAGTSHCATYGDLFFLKVSRASCICGLISSSGQLCFITLPGITCNVSSVKS